MVAAAAWLLRRQGYAATGWRQVVREADAPWGSQSHHFPGGKEQLATAALDRAGARYQQLLEAALVGVHPADMVDGWARLAAGQLEASGWADGCPIATVALEQAHESDALALACHTALASWVATIADAVESRGVATGEARSLAVLVVAGIEGALLLSRTARDPEPLLLAGAELAAILRSRVV
jgi:TetR/AcrR family transcriptional repressor of lmrAB and yxaGH operons